MLKDVIFYFNHLCKHQLEVPDIITRNINTITLVYLPAIYNKYHVLYEVNVITCVRSSFHLFNHSNVRAGARKYWVQNCFN